MKKSIWTAADMDGSKHSFAKKPRFVYFIGSKSYSWMTQFGEIHGSMLIGYGNDMLKAQAKDTLQEWEIEV